MNSFPAADMSGTAQHEHQGGGEEDCRHRNQTDHGILQRPEQVEDIVPVIEIPVPDRNRIHDRDTDPEVFLHHRHFRLFLHRSHQGIDITVELPAVVLTVLFRKPVHLFHLVLEAGRTDLVVGPDPLVGHEGVGGLALDRDPGILHILAICFIHGFRIIDIVFQGTVGQIAGLGTDIIRLVVGRSIEPAQSGQIQ